MLALESMLNYANLLLPSMTQDIESAEVAHHLWRLVLRSKPQMADHQQETLVTIRQEDTHSVIVDLPGSEERPSFMLGSYEDNWRFLQYILEGLASGGLFIGEGASALTRTLNLISEIPDTMRFHMLAAFYRMGEGGRHSTWCCRLLASPVDPCLKIVLATASAGKSQVSCLGQLRWDNDRLQLELPEGISKHKRIRGMIQAFYGSQSVQAMLAKYGVTPTLIQRSVEQRDWLKTAERARATVRNLSDEGPIEFRFFGEGPRMSVQLAAGDRTALLCQITTRQAQQPQEAGLFVFHVAGLSLELPSLLGYEDLLVCGMLLGLTHQSERLVAELDVTAEQIDQLWDSMLLHALVEPPAARFLSHWLVCYFSYWRRNSDGNIPVLSTDLYAGGTLDNVFDAMLQIYLQLDSDDSLQQFRHLRSINFRDDQSGFYEFYEPLRVEMRVTRELPIQLPDRLGRAALVASQNFARALDDIELEAEVTMQSGYTQTVSDVHEVAAAPGAGTAE